MLLLHFTNQSVVSHMPGDVRVTGRSAAGLDRRRFCQSPAGMFSQTFTSSSHTGHLPRLLAFPTSHRALTIIYNKLVPHLNILEVYFH